MRASQNQNRAGKVLLGARDGREVRSSPTSSPSCELESERVAAREAESKAAKQQQQAVNDAVKAVEEIAKGAQDRAVARALAAAGVKAA